MTVPIVLIAAVGRNGSIGHRDGLPWRLPTDMRHFKAETMGKPVVMGRKTWASLGRPLVGRHPVVVSRDAGLMLPEGVERATSVEEALGRAQAIAAERVSAEVMVAGGAEVYRAAMPFADALLITEVDLDPEADSFFPAIDPAIWREVRRLRGSRGLNDQADFAITRLTRSPHR